MRARVAAVVLSFASAGSFDEATREHVLDAVRISIQQQIEDHRCPSHCRAHERALAELPRLVGTWRRELTEIVVDEKTVVLRFDVFDGHSMPPRYEIQHVAGKSVILELCYEYVCEPRSQPLTTACWDIVDRALDNADFWEAKELISEAHDLSRYDGPHTPMFTIEGKRGDVHRLFRFSAPAYKEELQPADRLAKDLWRVVDRCLHPCSAGSPLRRFG